MTSFRRCHESHAYITARVSISSTRGNVATYLNCCRPTSGQVSLLCRTSPIGATIPRCAKRPVLCLPYLATCVPQISLIRTTSRLATTDHTCRECSNPSQNQKRNLKPTVSAGAYSASPSQLTLSTDQLSSHSLNQNPYQTYGYGHDPNAFSFQPQPQQQYRQPQIPQPLKTDYHPQQLQQQPHHQLPSPTNLRKRRISELGGEPIPGSSNPNLGGYGNPHNPFTAGPGGEVDLGMPSAQTLPSPLPKKGRTNTPWTPAEEQRLKTLRDAGSSWSEIAKTFPLRTEGSVKKHWYKVRVCFLRSCGSCAVWWTSSSMVSRRVV